MLSRFIRSTWFTFNRALDSLPGAGRQGSPQPVRILLGDMPSWCRDIRARLDPRVYRLSTTRFEEADFADHDAIIPFRIRELKLLNTLSPVIRARAIIPSLEAIERLDDKQAFHQALCQMGYESFTPRRLESFEILSRASDPSLFPFVLKKRRSEWGEHSIIIKDAEQLAGCRQQLSDEAFMMQHYVAGEHEYASHILMKNGTVRFLLNVHYAMPRTPIIRGNAHRVSIKRFDGSDQLRPFFGKLLNDLGFDNGTCCIDYKMTAGKPQIFEINPRFGGSLARAPKAYVEAYLSALGEGRPA